MDDKLKVVGTATAPALPNVDAEIEAKATEIAARVRGPWGVDDFRAEFVRCREANETAQQALAVAQAKALAAQQAMEHARTSLANARVAARDE